MGSLSSTTTRDETEESIIIMLKLIFLVCIPMFSLAKNLEPLNYKPPSKVVHNYQNENQMGKITDRMEQMLDLFDTNNIQNTDEKDLNASIDEILTLALDLSELLDDQIKLSESQEKMKGTFIPIHMSRMRYKRNGEGVDEVPITRMRY